MMKCLFRILCLLCLMPLLCPALSAACAETVYPPFEPVELTMGADYALPKKNYLPDPEAFTENGYRDESINVVIHRVRAYDTDMYIAYIQVASPLQLRVEQAKRYPSKALVRGYLLAGRVNSVIATNADWFVYRSAGVIYREGELLRDKPMEEYDGLFIDTDGDLHIVSPLTPENVAAIEKPIWQSFCFGPALVIDGEKCDRFDIIWPRGVESDRPRQRTAFGQIGPLQYVMLVTEGAEIAGNRGLTVEETATVMHDLGCLQAYNMDGGMSSTMLLKEDKLDGGDEVRMRSIGDILYFSTAVGE